METYYNYIKDHGWDDVSGAVYACGIKLKEYWNEQRAKYELWEDYRNFDTEMSMLMQYIKQYNDSDEGFLEVIAAEEKFELILPLLVSAGSGVDEITYSGVIDLRCKMHGSTWLIDHKTTGGSVSTEAAKLNRSIQFIGYAWGEKEIYGESEGFIANFAGCSCRKKKDGTWGKQNVTFTRSPQLYTDEDFDVFLIDINDTAAMVARCMNDGFPKNYDACYNYGRCGMYNQCQSGSLTPIEGYTIDPDPGSKLTYE